MPNVAKCHIRNLDFGVRSSAVETIGHGWNLVGMNEQQLLVCACVLAYEHVRAIGCVCVCVCALSNDGEIPESRRWLQKSFPGRMRAVFECSLHCRVLGLSANVLWAEWLV